MCAEVADNATLYSPSQTVLRRMQRKHSQISYKLMKAKLLALVSPMPTPAIQATDLEAFRATIYTVKQTANYASPTGSTCWCGIWLPLPSQPVETMPPEEPSVEMDSEGELGNQPTVATLNVAVAAPCSPDPDMNTEGELGNQPTVATLNAAFAAPCADQDMAEYNKYRPSMDMIRHSLAPEALKAKWASELPVHMQTRCMKRYRFKRTLAVVPEPVQTCLKRYIFEKQHSVVPLEYSHVDSTGECKAQ